jgi:shikimate kinase
MLTTAIRVIMSEVIEFIGPPGVGKSTIYSGLVKSWKKSNAWAPIGHFLPGLNKPNPGTFGLLELQIRKLLRRPAYNRRKITGYAYKFLGENPQFVSLCWDLIDRNRKEDHLGVDNRFRSAYYLFSVFGNYQAIRNSSDPRACVTDELLVHRIIQITKTTIDTGDLSEFVDMVPIPHAIVHLDAPADVLTERLLKRKKHILRHKSLQPDQLYELSRLDKTRLDTVANLLGKRGTALLNVDTQKSTVTECVDQIIYFLNNR